MIRLCAALLVGVVTAQYLAGVLLLLSLHAPVRNATPLTIARYAYFHHGRAEMRRRLWWCFGIGWVSVAAGAVCLLLPKPKPLHGEARFATRGEIARAGLLGDEGVLIGEIRGRYLIVPGQQGALLAAPPRSGKGVGICVPNLLHWPGSVVATDIKRENWSLTAGYRRASGQACFLVDPLSETGATARWNPLSYVGESHAARINDLQRIADMFYIEVPGTDPFWIASARTLFLGVALFVFETQGLPRTVGEVLRQGMASSDEGFGEHWRRVIEVRAKGDHPLSPECVQALCDVVDLAPVTASSVRKSFTSRLDLWLNPMLDAATSGNDFDLRDLRRRPMSIYVGVSPEDLRRLRPVLALFFQQCIGEQTVQLPEHDATLRYQVLLLLDECTALGRIPVLADAIAYLPGYGVRTIIIVQALAQLKEVYGEHGADTLVKSLAVRILFAPKDFSDAKEISDQLGTTTVKAHSVTRQRSFKFASTSSVNISEQRRPLLLPQEVLTVGNERQIILYEGLRPILAKKIRYYCDRRFQARLKPAPVQPRIVLPAPVRVSGAPQAAAPEDPKPKPERPRAVRRRRRDAPPDAESVDELPRLTAPAGDAWTATELTAAVDEFLRNLPT